MKKQIIKIFLICLNIYLIYFITNIVIYTFGIEKENKVKVTLVLFGREKMHANLGVTTLDEIAEKFAEIAEVEKKYADKQKHLILSPKKIK